jgi:hypothetical protein
MAKYRKTALIEAAQWFAHGDHEAVRMRPKYDYSDGPEHFIETMEGRLTVVPGTWIAGPGAKGEFWPIADEVFRTTYERVDDA